MSAEQLELFNQPIPEVIERLTFNQFMRLFKALYWDKKKESKRTGSICNYMVIHFDGKFIDTMGRHETLSLLNWLRTVKNYKAWSLIKARSILRLMFNVIEIWKEDGLVGGYDFTSVRLPRKNPTFKVVMPTPPRPTLFLNPMEFRGWIKAAKKAGDFGFEAAFKLGLWFRLSPIDLENLNDSEIDEQAFEIRVHRRHTITDRNPEGCLQVIALTEKAWAFINRCRQYRKKGETKIIPIQINARRRFAKIRKIAREMGLRDMTLSALRRSGADYILEKGYTKDAVSDALGHTTDKIVEKHYASKKRAPYRREITAELVAGFTE